MKFKDIEGLSIAEMKKKKAATNTEIFDAKMKNELGQLANPVQVRFLRRDLARINTAIAQKNGR